MDGACRAFAILNRYDRQIAPAEAAIAADVQARHAELLADTGLTLRQGRVVADDAGRSGVPSLYVGGDCRLGGRDLTVEAVEDGKRAARAIHSQLCA